GRDGCVLTEPRTHHAGNKRPNKSRQCTAHVAERTERHDPAVEGEHERDQWSRDEIRAEFAGHLLYPAICQRPCSCQPFARPSCRRHKSRSTPRIAPLQETSPTHLQRRGAISVRYLLAWVR